MRMKSRRDSALIRNEKALNVVLEELREGNPPIIVEGKRDRAALVAAGISNPIFTLTGRPEELAELVSRQADRAVILTDFDAAGEELLARLESALQGCNVTPDTVTRRRLGGLLGVRFFQDFDRRLLAFREKVNGGER